MGAVPVIVLDTHALIWWASGETAQLSKNARKAIDKEREEGHICVSSISAWEISMLVARGRIHLSMDVSEWLSIAGQIPALRFVPVDNEIAVKSNELPGAFHPDPADRMIVATARKLGAPIVTKDEKIRAYPHVRAIW